MIFKYFKGPIDEMSGLVIEHSVCSICGKTDHCFELYYTITNVFSDDENNRALISYVFSIEYLLATNLMLYRF